MQSIGRISLICLVCSFVWAAPVHAQYPSKPVRFILPFPPGGGTDALARAMGNRLSEALGQQIVIDNRPGAGANIGAELAAKAPPDGHTLFMMTSTHAINVTLYRNLGYSLVKDFAPVSLLGSTAMVVVVHPSIPAKSVKELIALAKARPGQISHSSSGTGSITQLAAELFKDKTGVNMLHIPYKGGGPSVIALVSGEAAVGFTTTPSCITQIKAGRLRGLAITTAKRSPFLPHLPTVAEAGVPGYDAEVWYGMLVPSGTPREIIARLHTESVKAMQFPDVKSRLDATGLVAIGSNPEKLGAYIGGEIDKWGKVVKALALRVD
ncbi:MAG: tripartite tricarboxylate transporter substrate binding protein [Betaproteobacteria bacterium]|nr:tripartite tricarboxylate transporter substrate binding protein [Betaproteobacteria bacterium]